MSGIWVNTTFTTQHHGHKTQCRYCSVFTGRIFLLYLSFVYFCWQIFAFTQHFSNSRTTITIYLLYPYYILQSYRGCCLCLITKLESDSQEMLDSDLAENGPHNIFPGVCTLRQAAAAAWIANCPKCVPFQSACTQLPSWKWYKLWNFSR